MTEDMAILIKADNIFERCKAMKKFVALIIASGMIVSAGPISAADQKGPSERELCILYAQDCANKVYHLQNKIKKIQNEIDKGATVYNADELEKLVNKLKEAEVMMDKLTPPSSQH